MSDVYCYGRRVQEGVRDSGYLQSDGAVVLQLQRERDEVVLHRPTRQLVSVWTSRNILVSGGTLGR